MKKILLDYLKAHNGEWFKKVSLYILADENGYSPESCGRELRALEEEGKIQKQFYSGKYASNLVKYSYGAIPEKVKKVIIINGKPTLTYA